MPMQNTKQNGRKSAFGRLGANIVENAPSFPGVLEVVHSITGRMRVKIPSMKGNRTLAESIIKAISPVRGIRKISANTLLGTLLVEYDPAVLTPVIVVSALSYCFGFDAEIHSRKSVFAREVSTIGSAFNEAVLQRTHGVFDLRAIMMLLLILQILKTIPFFNKKAGLPNLPSFPINLLWWLFQSINNNK